MSGVHGLEGVPNTSMLHHAHQPRQTNAPGDKMVAYLPISDAAFGSTFYCNLTPIDMVVEEAYVELNLTTAGGTAGAKYVSAPNMVGTNGIQLRFDQTSVYTQSEFETMYYDLLHFPHSQMLRRRYISNCLSGDSIYAYNSTTIATQSNQAAGGTIYLPLNAISDKILKNIGPLSAWAAGKWSVAINLVAVANAVTGTDAVAGTGAVSSARLVLIGHREDSKNAQGVSLAAAGDGIKIVFSQANHGVFTALSGATDAPLNFGNLSGEMTGFIIGKRTKAAYTALTGSTLDKVNWVNASSLTDTIEAGILSSPTRVFGIAVPQFAAQNVFPSDSFEGSNYAITDTSFIGPLADLTHSRLDLALRGIIPVAMEEKATMGQRFGTFSGAMRINQDLIITLRETFAADTRIDCDVLIRRILVVRHAGFVLVNEE
jgi:hypothetical protein